MKKLVPDKPKRKLFNRRRIQLAYSVLRWHGRLGVAAAFLFLILLATGIALNHTDRLALDQRFITTEWLLNWYGIAPTNTSVSYKVNSHWVTELDGHLFWDGALIYEHAGSVKGALQVRERFVITTPDALYLFDQDASLIERIVDLPAKVSRLGWRDQYIYIDTPIGVFFTNSTFLVWQQADQMPNWVQVTGAPDAIEDDVLRAYRGQGLPWERVLLDLHSGRILGIWGPYLIDGAAIALLILVCSGFYNWMIRR